MISTLEEGNAKAAKKMDFEKAAELRNMDWRFAQTRQGQCVDLPVAVCRAHRSHSL
jgi:excinuclease UvrABC nuclease subunit